MHKTIGIDGGMTPESTTIYYETITRGYSERFGDYGFPRIVINSMSFQQFVDWMNNDAWDTIADALTIAVKQLSDAGADLAVLATNTMHMVFNAVETRSEIPMISIIDATARAIKSRNIACAGLLGTRFTMQKPFYREGLLKGGIQTVVPDASSQQKVHDIIFEELGKGMGLLSASISAGLIVGPVLGGVLLNYLNWRSIFYTRVPFGIIVTIMALIMLKKDRPAGGPIKFDIPGTLTSSGATPA